MAKKKAKATADVRFIVNNNNGWRDEGTAQVFETLDEAKDYYQEMLEDENIEQSEVEDVEIMEVKVVATHHLYVDKRYEVSVGGE